VYDSQPLSVAFLRTIHATRTIATPSQNAIGFQKQMA
jgi:hypothetical protein